MEPPHSTQSQEVKAIEEEFTRLLSLLAPVFANISGLQNAENYLKGLLSSAERKNGWQIAESQGEETPSSIQQFIYRGKYSADTLRDVLSDYVCEILGEDDGVLVVDETGFLKQGKMSCGVKRQYSGTAGKVANCQIGTFVIYASKKGHAPIDRRLYIPSDWIEDRDRCTEAGVPDSVEFQTKPKMALEMIQEATLAGVPYTWVTGDCVYGEFGDLRLWLEDNGKCYVMDVSGRAYVWEGSQKRSVGDILENLPSEGWFEASCGDGSKGLRIYDWLSWNIDTPNKPGWQRFFLVRRSKTEPDDLRAYLCFAPMNTPTQKLIEVAGTRWTVETSFKENKSQVGLDHYEVRGYDAWYKHITFSCIALAFLTAVSCNSGDTLTLQQHDPASKTLDEFKKKRNLHV